MKRLLLLGLFAAALLVPLAAAAPATTSTLRGTVVATDRAHHALVVARPGGAVQMVIAQRAFARTAVGRTVVIRFSSTAGRFPVAVNVALKGHARTALVRGTIVRLVNQRAVVNAGGSLLRVTLKQAGAQRTTTSATSGPHVGDEVEIEVEFDHHGALGATVVTADDDEAGGEMEVRGVVSALTPATTILPGSITVTVNGLPVSCAIPLGVMLTVKVGDRAELKCDLVGNPAVWMVRVAKNEDDRGAHSGPGRDNVSQIEVRGTIAAPFLPTSTTITVTPGHGGAAVTCTIVAGSLIHFAAGDVVKMECLKIGDTLKLREIEKSDDDSSDGHSGHGSGGGHDDGGGDDHGGGGHDD